VTWGKRKGGKGSDLPSLSSRSPDGWGEGRRKKKGTSTFSLSPEKEGRGLPSVKRWGGGKGKQERKLLAARAKKKKKDWAP